MGTFIHDLGFETRDKGRLVIFRNSSLQHAIGIYKNESFREIDNMQSIQGMICINSPNHALNFVRISSSSRCYFLLRDKLRFVEILVRGLTEYNPVFGEKEFFSTMMKYYPSGFMGIIDINDQVKCGYIPPISEKIRDLYFVSRYMLRLKDYKLILLHQFVSFNGIITNSIEHEIPSRRNTFQWGIFVH